MQSHKCVKWHGILGKLQVIWNFLSTGSLSLGVLRVKTVDGLNGVHLRI